MVQRGTENSPFAYTPSSNIGPTTAMGTFMNPTWFSIIPFKSSGSSSGVLSISIPVNSLTHSTLAAESSDLKPRGIEVFLSFVSSAINIYSLVFIVLFARWLLEPPYI